MFKEALYIHGNYSGTTHNKEQILKDIKKDLLVSSPVHVATNNTRIFITFEETCSITAYTLPVEYKTILNL